MFQIARVAVDKATWHYDKLYDYYLPVELEGRVRPGCRVTVPFGSYNHRRLAIVLALSEDDTREKRKPVSTLVDEAPLLNTEMLGLLRYLKEHTYCTWFDGLRAILPAGIGVKVGVGLKLERTVKLDASELTEEERRVVGYLSGKRKEVQEETLLKELGLVSKDLVRLKEWGAVSAAQLDRRRVQDEKAVMVRLTPLVDEGRFPKLTEKQKAVVGLLEGAVCASLKEVCYYCGVTRAVVDKLCAIGAAEYFDQEVYRNPYAGRGMSLSPPSELSADQKKAFDQLYALYRREGPKGALLYGVTGSGKTQVFLRLIRQVVEEDKRVIVLVPEISLTPQTVEMFHSAFGGRVAVLHSGLAMGERLDEWKRIRAGEADVVVGTRSAVFAPVDNLGLIVIDEEQEGTYKSESSPRFHAREVARVRCRYHGAMLLLASATPSVESFYQAKQGKLALVTLKERYSAARLPDVYIVDLKEDPAASGGISARLGEELYLNLQKREQSILLLNRRGHTTTVKCSQCGQTATCPNCSISLTYHAANNRLMCHYCGYSRPVEESCPHCGSKLIRYTGAGTQRVEEELRERFPDARVLRMDMDTTMARFSHEEKFAAFARGEYDIMVGTQMVAKGLNFPRVTLVGVLSADQSLYSDDFRSFEKTFSLLTQVVGRGGRGELPGRAFVQTFSPENRIIELASTQNYEEYYAEEIAYRKLGLYPPYCELGAVGFVSPREDLCREAAKRFAGEFSRLAGTEYKDLPIRALGPTESAVFKVAGKYRCRYLIKYRSSARFRELMARMLDWFYADRRNKEVTAFADPYYDGSI